MNMPGAPISGKQASFNRTVGVKQDVDEAIVILPVDDVPLQRALSTRPTESIKVEWLEESLTPQTVTVSSVSGTASPWTLTLSTIAGEAEAELVRVGDVFRLSTAAADYDTQFLVTATDEGANTITVASFGGTADTDDPVATDTLELIGQYNEEGGDPKDARAVDRTTKFNYTQIGQEQVEVTRTQRKRAMYGLNDPYDHEAGKKFRELGIRFEKALVNGVRTISNDNKKRFMGGLLYYITTNAQSGTKANVKSLIEALVKSSYERGGNALFLMVSPSVKVAISQNIDAALRRTETSDIVAGYVVDKVRTDFGVVEVFANRHFPRRKGLLLQTMFDKRVVFDGYFHEFLAKTGDREHGEIVGEHSLEVKNEEAQGVLTVTDA